MCVASKTADMLLLLLRRRPQWLSMRPVTEKDPEWRGCTLMRMVLLVTTSGCRVPLVVMVAMRFRRTRTNIVRGGGGIVEVVKRVRVERIGTPPNPTL